MNAEELKQALWRQKSVRLQDPRHGDIEYNRVSAVIYRYSPAINGVYMQVELEDPCGRSVIVCNPKDVEIIKEKAI